MWSILCFSVLLADAGYNTSFVHLRGVSYLTHRLWVPGMELAGLNLNLIIQRSDIQNLIFDQSAEDFGYDLKLTTQWPGWLNLGLSSARALRRDRLAEDSRATDTRYLGGEITVSLPWLQLHTQLGDRASWTRRDVQPEVQAYEFQQELRTNLKPLNLYWNLFWSRFAGMGDERGYISLEPGEELRFGRAAVGFGLNLDRVHQSYPELKRALLNYGGFIRMRAPLFPWLDLKIEEELRSFGDEDSLHPKAHRWGQTSKLRADLGLKFPALRLDAMMKRDGAILNRGADIRARYRVGDELGQDKSLELRLAWKHPKGDLVLERQIGLSSVTTPHPLNPEDRDEKVDGVRISGHARISRDLKLHLGVAHLLSQLIWVECFMSGHTRAQERYSGEAGVEGLLYNRLRVSGGLSVRQDELRFRFAPEERSQYRQGELRAHIGYEANPRLQPILDLGYGMERSLESDHPIHRARAGFSLGLIPWKGFSLTPRADLLLWAGRGWEAPQEFFYPRAVLGLRAEGDLGDKLRLEADLKLERGSDEALDWLGVVDLNYRF